MSGYAEFLESKRRVFHGDGIEAQRVPPQLYPWQAAIVRWAARKGRASIFADCGLGKSFMQIAWAMVLDVPTLFLAPLCVAEQTVSEAAKLGATLRYARDESDAAGAQLVITNYERLEKFDVSRYHAVVLDESSILKSFDGKTRTRLIETFAATKYRLCCTATPSPNDISELANHAEFMGLVTRAEFLATWFIHDDAGWRMKRHAVQPFYRWLSSWAVAVSKPSDLGYDDGGFALPPLNISDVVLDCENAGDSLFPELGVKGIQGRLSARRASLADRARSVVGLVVKSFHDESEQARLHEAVARGKQGPRQGVSGSKKRYSECSASGTLRKGRGEANRRKREIVGVAARESVETEATTPEDIRAIDGAVLGVASESGREMCDLRMVGYEQAVDLSACRSLPCYGPSPGCSLPELQSWYREVQERFTVATASGRLPKWLLWCGLNEEQDALNSVFGEHCVSVQGSDSYAEKVGAVRSWLTDPTIPIMISKPKVLGFGMNFQHCNHMAFVGLSDSYETYYQCIRRCWRYGQRSAVDVSIVVSDAERGIVENVRRKERAAASLSSMLLEHMREFERAEVMA